MTMESGISNMWDPVTHKLGHFLRSPHTTNKALLDVLGASEADSKCIPFYSQCSFQSQALRCLASPQRPRRPLPQPHQMQLAHGDGPINHSAKQSKVLANTKPFQQAACAPPQAVTW